MQGCVVCNSKYIAFWWWRRRRRRRILLSHSNAINTQHCGRLPEKTNVRHAGHLNKKNTHREREKKKEEEITYEHKLAICMTMRIQEFLKKYDCGTTAICTNFADNSKSCTRIFMIFLTRWEDVLPATNHLIFQRDAMCKSSLYCRPVSPVRLSVRHDVLYIYTAENVVKLCSPSGCSNILVFNPYRRYSTPREPLKGGGGAKYMGEIYDFWLKSPFISETVRDRPIVATEC